MSEVTFTKRDAARLLHATDAVLAAYENPASNLANLSRRIKEYQEIRSEFIKANPTTEADRLREILRRVECDLLEVDRYRNMKSFPVVVDICKKAANTISHSMGYRLPFPDHYSAEMIKNLSR